MLHSDVLRFGESASLGTGKPFNSCLNSEMDAVIRRKAIGVQG